MFLKKQKGITLIALAITIAILTILATIAINAALGDNGIISVTKKVKEADANKDIRDSEEAEQLMDFYDERIIQEESISKSMGYVVDGLLLHYDGINNTGDSGHSSSATVWKDLSGHERNGTLRNTVTWNNDSLNFNGGWVSIGEINPEDITFEIVVENTVLRNVEVIYIGNYQSGGYGLLYNNQSLGNINATAFSINNVGYKYVSSGGANVVVNKKYALTGRYDREKISFFENNQKYLSERLAYGIKSPNANTILALGTNPSGSSAEGSYFYGNMYSVRVYNRALTDAEVAHNYMIDKERFNIE